MKKARPALTRSEIMSRVKGRDTRPEMRLRRALHAAGLRYRLQATELPGRPDIVFRRAKLAIFVHGCFWHGHDCPRGARTPKANRDYWLAKIARNMARDAAAVAALATAGWRVETVWECELRDSAAFDARLADLLVRSR